MGAGAIGGFVGGCLLASHAADVTLVGRESLADEVAEHGLTVVGFGREDHVPPDRARVETDASALANCDVILVCVKSGATESTAEAMAPVLREDAVVVSLQNGVRNAETLREQLPRHRVVPGVVGFNVVMRENATFVHSFSGPLVLEAEDTPFDRSLVTALRSAGLDVKVVNPIAPEQWTKLLTNLNNAIAALSGAATPAMILSPGYRRLMTMLLDEGRSVLREAGIPTAKFRGAPLSVMSVVFKLPTPLVRLVLGAQLKLDPESRASMWFDLERGRPTEVDYLNGEIVRLAEANGSDAPLNRRLVELVHEAERAGKGSPGLSAEALTRAVGK